MCRNDVKIEHYRLRFNIGLPSGLHRDYVGGEISNIMKKYSKVQVAQNLEKAIGSSVGIKGLQTLLHGWLNYRQHGKKYRHAIHARDWLYITEVMDLSTYAGYDLT